MLTDDELKKIESWAGRHSSPFAYSAGASIKETLQLVDDHRALSARVAELGQSLDTFMQDNSELETQRDALTAKNQTLANELSECISDRDNERAWATQYSQDVGKLEDTNRALFRVMDGLKKDFDALAIALEARKVQTANLDRELFKTLAECDEVKAQRDAAQKALGKLWDYIPDGVFVDRETAALARQAYAALSAAGKAK